MPRQSATMVLEDLHAVEVHGVERVREGVGLGVNLARGAEQGEAVGLVACVHNAAVGEVVGGWELGEDVVGLGEDEGEDGISEFGGEAEEW